MGHPKPGCKTVCKKILVTPKKIIVKVKTHIKKHPLTVMEQCRINMKRWSKQYGALAKTQATLSKLMVKQKKAHDIAFIKTHRKENDVEEKIDTLRIKMNKCRHMIKQVMELKLKKAKNAACKKSNADLAKKIAVLVK